MEIARELSPQDLVESEGIASPATLAHTLQEIRNLHSLLDRSEEDDEREGIERRLAFLRQQLNRFPEHVSRRDALICMHLKWAQNVGRSLAVLYSMDPNEAAQEACVALMRCVDAFDPVRNPNLRAFSGMSIRRHVLRVSKTSRIDRPCSLPDYMRQKVQIILEAQRALKSADIQVSSDNVLSYIALIEGLKQAIAESGSEDTKFPGARAKALKTAKGALCLDVKEFTTQIDKKREELQGGKCTLPEGWSLEVIDFVRAEVLPMLGVSSLDQPMPSSNPEKPRFLRDTIPAPSSPDGLEREQLSAALREVMASLNERQRRILEERYFGEADGKDGLFSFKEIGKEMGLSRERVRQIEKGAFKKIRDGAHRQALRSFL